MKYYAAKLSDKGTVAVDDTILVKGIEATAGSRILEGFKPLFSAEAVVRLEKEGYEIAGKTHVGRSGCRRTAALLLQKQKLNRLTPQTI